MPLEKHQQKRSIVIIGAGFGGLALAKGLKSAPVEITLLDSHNHHLFQPLLYQVATASLSSTSIISPIRAIFNKQDNIRVMMEKVIAIDTSLQLIKTSSGNDYPYDYVVIATGAHHSYFGHEEWEKYAPGIKNVKDALRIREKILLAFEKAELTHDVQERNAYLTFVIVGAGPTGVEMAGAVRELSAHSLAKDFKNIPPEKSHIILVEASTKILSAFPEKLSTAALTTLKKMGIQVRTQEKVIEVKEDGVVLESGFISSKTIIWAAGVKASPAATWLSIQADPAGRILVNPDFSAPTLSNIFVIGDVCAYRQNGHLLPGTAAVAKQEGYYLACAISRKLKNKKIKPFRYRNYGNLAAIGRKYAIADFGIFQTAGVFGYILWWIVHIYFLIGFRNRISVTLNWLWSHFTFQRGARLIIKEIDKE